MKCGKKKHSEVTKSAENASKFDIFLTFFLTCQCKKNVFFGGPCRTSFCLFIFTFLTQFPRLRSSKQKLDFCSVKIILKFWGGEIKFDPCEGVKKNTGLDIFYF